MVDFVENKFAEQCRFLENFLLLKIVESYNGSVLRLTRLERKQMGAYLCIASNDVPPAVSKRVSLSVHCKLIGFIVDFV